MKWIIGLDLRPRSRGALRLARWLAEATRDHGADELVAVHVLTDKHLRTALLLHHLDEVVEGARAEALRCLDEAGCSEIVKDVEVTQALTADEGLEQARARHGADGLLVGRAAPAEGHHLVRLGSVARRLLRGLPCPVVVAPPDLDPASLGPGPVVALSSLADDAVEACRLAARLAGRLARTVSIAHVVDDPRAGTGTYLPTTSLERWAGERIAEGEQELTRWVAASGLRPDATAVLQGEVLHSALAFAQAQRAPLVVAGARRLGGLDRVFSPTVGGALAATAPVPVAIVPAAS
jgi:nucleotide-binding universal stress UspA family protein